jgi:GT2 family glycosyltransferase
MTAPTAVVVNHDAGDVLRTCVASLRAEGVAHVVVVDNASTDGSLEALVAEDPTVVLVRTGANLGYGS